VTDGRTDGRSDGIAIAYARLADMLSRAKTIPGVCTIVSCCVPAFLIGAYYNQLARYRVGKFLKKIRDEDHIIRILCA